VKVIAEAVRGHGPKSYRLLFPSTERLSPQHDVIANQIF
jgi:hypothetical protein